MSARGVTFRQRLELRLARVIPLLTPRLQVRLSGKPPVQREGQTLAPDLQLMLSAVERRGRPPYEEMSVERARYEMRAGSFAAGGTPDPSISPKVLEIEGAAGPLPAHLYEAPAIPRPAGASAEDGTPASRPPLIVFLHGGGFVLGDLASHDVPCRILARHAGAHVLS